MLNNSVLVIGIYFVVVSFILTTKNFKSSLFFKIIPFFSGVICVLSAINNNGWISINF